MTRTKLSVLVPTFNCQIHLRECLESVKWADEILICDSYSTDATLEIARQYTNQIIQHEYFNSATQKNWAIPQATYDWILIIDSDELLDQGLQEEIRSLLENLPADHDGFRIPRKNLTFGRWTKSCRMYPDYNVRLFRKAVGRYEDKEVHADVIVPGQVGALENAFIHHDFEDVVETIAKWARYIRYEGDQMSKVGRSYHWYGLLFRPLIVFFYFYFVTGAFREGFRGFYVSVMWSFYVFAKHARLWQLEWQKSPDGVRYWNEGVYDIQ